MKKTSRRKFMIQSSLAAGGLSLGLNALAKPRIIGANEKIRVGFIGIGNRGTQLLHRFMKNEDVEIAAFSDAYQPYMTRNENEVDARWKATGKTPSMGEEFPNKVKQYDDFRKLLDDKSIDAVVISTPDHWHAIQTIQALEAGKHVYVEKPLTITLKEGRMMVDAQKKYGQTVQVGLNRRGSSLYQELSTKVSDGMIGKVTTAQAYRISNMYPDGIGNMSAEEPPKGFDWDMWLGPRADRPYQYNIAPYFFRWWKDFSSQMGNWGVHYMDCIRWMLGEQAPTAISAHGGKYVLTDDRTIPDTMEVMFEFGSGAVVKFSIHEASSYRGIRGGEVELRGTKGTLLASQNKYEVVPAWSGQFQDWDQLVEPMEKDIKSTEAYGDLGIKEDSTARLIRNFLDCIKSGDAPWCSLEDGHRSTSFAHLANIALARGKRIEWDAEKEQVTNDPGANEMLHYQYRDKWDVI